MSSDLPLIPVAKPWMDEGEAAAVRRPILSGWVTQGPADSLRLGDAGAGSGRL